MHTQRTLFARLLSLTHGWSCLLAGAAGSAGLDAGGSVAGGGGRDGRRLLRFYQP